jgi:hypothetical protein
MKKSYTLDLTTQGPLYPPSEILDDKGNFVVIGKICKEVNGEIQINWGAAIIGRNTRLPVFGSLDKYEIIDDLDLENLGEYGERPLYTLPLPLPCNNYKMLFAPHQRPDANEIVRDSLPLHDAVPDFLVEHSRKYRNIITLNQWIKANGSLTVETCNNGHDANFYFDLKNLIPNSLYTVMAIRKNDLNPLKPTRPGPLGVPNCFVSDETGAGTYSSTMINPFPSNGGNRIINIVVLYMSSQCSNGGAIGIYGLGGDIHAHLKLQSSSFQEFNTVE